MLDIDDISHLNNDGQSLLGGNRSQLDISVVQQRRIQELAKLKIAHQEEMEELKKRLAKSERDKEKYLNFLS
jgi:hypothetical protein